MKDFDALFAKDREFTVCGETFQWHDVRPEGLQLWAEETTLEGFPLLDAQIGLFLDDDGRARWAELRKRDDNPVTAAMIIALVEWLMEEQSARPTQAPSPLASGRLKTAPTSKAA